MGDVVEVVLVTGQTHQFGWNAWWSLSSTLRGLKYTCFNLCKAVKNLSSLSLWAARSPEKPHFVPQGCESHQVVLTPNAYLVVAKKMWGKTPKSKGYNGFYELSKIIQIQWDIISNIIHIYTPIFISNGSNHECPFEYSVHQFGVPHFQTHPKWCHCCDSQRFRPLLLRSQLQSEKSWHQLIESG